MKAQLSIDTGYTVLGRKMETQMTGKQGEEELADWLEELVTEIREHGLERVMTEPRKPRKRSK